MEQTQGRKQATPKANTTSPSGRNVKASKIPLRARKNKKAKVLSATFPPHSNKPFCEKNKEKYYDYYKQQC